MATVQDVLETLFVAKGVETYARAYDKAIEKNQKLAQAQKGSAGARGVGAGGAAVNPIAAGIAAVAGEFVSLAAAVTLAQQTIQAGVQFMVTSLGEFAKAEDVVFRSTVVLNNVGSSLRPEGLQAMATALSQMSGIDDESIIQAGTALAQFGLGSQVSRDALESMADAAAATGRSIDQVAMAAARGARGSTRALLQMGIQFEATGDQAKDFNSILAEFDKRFSGAAAARRDTPAGAIDAMTTAIGNFKEAFGQAFSGVVIPLMDQTTRAIQGFTENMNLFFQMIAPGPMGTLLSLLTNAAPYKASYGSIGKGGAGLASEDTLKKVAQNTEKMSDAFVRQVLGGPGTVARGAFTLRDAALAFPGR